MFDWFRNLFSTSGRDRVESPLQHAGPSDQSAIQDEYLPLPFDQLRVEPDDTEDFDSGACERLLATLSGSGATNIDDTEKLAVRLEDFFEGNRCKHSIAANVEPVPPYDTIESWYELLKQIRGTAGVVDVVVGISAIEPYEDGRLGMWPYSDRIWIYSTLDAEAVASLVAPLEPDEVRDASAADSDYDLTPPYAAQDGVRPYWVWWD